MRTPVNPSLLCALLVGGLVGLGCSASKPAESTTVAGSTPAVEPGSTAGAGEDAGLTDCVVETRVVGLSTSDGVALEADYVASGREGAKAVVLLHMIPPGNDRTNFPPSFVSALAEAGYSVLNVDRRGAGASEGVAKDAYEGPHGRLDAVAALSFLASAPCAVRASDVAIVGASNGTTTALDYASEADEADRPAALAFLSPGGYTENQHTLAQGLEALGDRPVFVGYPPGERAWPEAARASAPGTWTFVEYEGGQHGSRLFSSNPEVANDVLSFLRAAVPPV